MNSAFRVDNLSASKFIHASGKVIKLSSEILQNRPQGITFFFFDFRIDPTQEDARIQQDLFCFQLYLQLPQQYFDIITNKVEDISSPAKKKSYQSAKNAGGVSAILRG